MNSLWARLLRLDSRRRRLVRSWTRGLHSACAIALLFCTSTLSANPPEDSDVYRPEMPDDPQGIPAVHVPGAGPRGGPVTFGTFNAVQVNVDAFGANILGDAANEPSIAIDPTNPMRMAIGWRQFDTTASNFRQAGIGYSTDGGASWTFPGVLDPGQFRSDPVLSFDLNGNFYYSSLSSVTSADVFKSADGGATWAAPVPAFGGDKQWIAVDRTNGPGRGNLYQFWNEQFSCCGDTDFTRSIDGAASFEAPQIIPTPSMKWGTLDVAPNGTLFLAGAALNGQTHLFQKSTNAQDPIQTPVFDAEATPIDLGGATVIGTAPNPAGLLGHVWLATDHAQGANNGNIYVLASVNPPGIDPLDVMFIRSTDGGASWTPPVRVNDDPEAGLSSQWFGTMAVSMNGRIDAVWNDTRDDPSQTFSQMYYSYSIDAGDHWSPSIPVTPTFNHTLGYPSQNKLGDYYHMIADANGASLAFAATFNGEQDVYFMRIVADCNGNGVHDANEMLVGTGLDCNDNQMLDACEDIYDSIPHFQLALLKPSELEGDLCLFDANSDGLVDGRDIQRFITSRLLP